MKPFDGCSRQAWLQPRGYLVFLMSRWISRPTEFSGDQVLGWWDVARKLTAVVSPADIVFNQCSQFIGNV